nr:immunoglobulin light chain junction region [Macaca mulatta]MOW61780.1 immunoglobulin light chain junction region [Macaca mulatta]MOW61849.1 immunoglobulin light chain junction region [Macaca mulatta]MOW61891.1 immunoglobulin light chain junction region [Macaca mulatta]MOW61905.1 immunoglobulin light chain junction region [Macaca mulatta]
CLQDIEYPLTF